MATVRVGAGAVMLAALFLTSLALAQQPTARGPARVALKVHRQPASGGGASLDGETLVEVWGPEDRVLTELEVHPKDESTYAVVAELRAGEVQLSDAHVTVARAGAPRIWRARERQAGTSARNVMAWSLSDLVDVARSFEDAGVAALVVTEIGRDGTLAGPALDQLSDVLAATTVDVVASGGVGTLDDLRALDALSVGGRRLAGAIVGRALYEGAFGLADAVAALA